MIEYKYGNSMVKKKYFIILFILILFSHNVFPEDIVIKGENIERNETDIRIYDLSGFTLELSCFNYFNIGLGYKWGSCSLFGSHYSAMDYGFFLEYKTKKELHFRLFFDMYGGSAGMLLGGSGIITTNFEEITFGIAPHIGVGFAGVKIYYRYNFYINNIFNCHEIVLVIGRFF